MTEIKLATIIGAQGFIGKALNKYLQVSGWQCHSTDRNEIWPVHKKNLGHIFYCAGLTADYNERPFDTIEAHVSLLARVLQSGSYESLTYLSSTRLYDSLSHENHANETACFSVSPSHPRHLYDLSKLMGEALCHRTGNGRARIARLSCVYNDYSDLDGFLPQLLNQVYKARAGDTIHINSSPYFARDYIHLSDVLQALVLISQYGSQSIYNVASGENYSNAQLAKFIEEKSGRRLVFDLSEKVLANTPCIDISRMKNEFHWRPTQLEDCLSPWLEALV